MQNNKKIKLAQMKYAAVCTALACAVAFGSSRGNCEEPDAGKQVREEPVQFFGLSASYNDFLTHSLGLNGYYRMRNHFAWIEFGLGTRTTFSSTAGLASFSLAVRLDPSFALYVSPSLVIAQVTNTSGVSVGYIPAVGIEVPIWNRWALDVGGNTNPIDGLNNYNLYFRVHYNFLP